MFFDCIMIFFPRPARRGLSSFFPGDASKIDAATTPAFSPFRNGVPAREFVPSFASIACFLLFGVVNPSTHPSISSFTDDATIICEGWRSGSGDATSRLLRHSRSSSASWLSETIASAGMEEWLVWVGDLGSSPSDSWQRREGGEARSCDARSEPRWEYSFYR